MINEKEIQSVLDLLKSAPTTYGVAHGMRAAVDKLFALRDAAKAGYQLMPLTAIEAGAILAARSADTNEQTIKPSGPQPPAGALAPSVVS